MAHCRFGCCPVTSGAVRQLGQVRVAALKAVQMSRYFPDILPVLDFCPGLHTYPTYLLVQSARFESYKVFTAWLIS